MVEQSSDEVPVVAVGRDRVVETEAVVTNHESVTIGSPTSEVSHRDVLVIVERLCEPSDFLVE